MWYLYNVQCYGTLWKRYGTLRECYGAIAERFRCVTEPLWHIMEHCRSVMGRCRALWNIMEHCATLWRCCETLRGIMVALRKWNGALSSVTEALWDVRERYGGIMGRYWMLQKHCRALWNFTEALRIIMEPLWKISILPILNSILNFAHR